MTFQATLERHLRAINERDLTALKETLAPERLLLVTSQGQLLQTSREFLELHREWFKSRTWSLNSQPIAVHESDELAAVLLKLDYFDRQGDQPELHEVSYLTLVFAKADGRWELVQDQNTPCRRLPA